MIIRALYSKKIVLPSGENFSIPEGFTLDYADSEDGILSYHSNEGFWRYWTREAGEKKREYVPYQYFVKKMKFRIK